MTRHRIAPLTGTVLLVGLLLPGCVPVSEPLSDPEKAEPDERLIGVWEKVSGGATGRFRIDSPEVEGNPRGLMRAVTQDDKDTLWFFTTSIGEERYATIFVGKDDTADFAKPGALEAWRKQSEKGYFIFRYALDGDTLVVDGGNGEQVAALMKSENIDKGPEGFYKTPAGWLAGYLEEHGPGRIFSGKVNVHRYRRVRE